MLDLCIVATLRYLRSKGLSDLATMLRSTFKEGPDAKASNSLYKMWEEQLAVNLPVLYLASQALAAHAREMRCTRLLFAARDCCHWHPLFQAMYPEFDSHYLHCSRNMFNGARKTKNKHYDEYVEKLCGLDDKGRLDVDHTMYVDVHGTGQRMVKYFEQRWKGRVPYCYLLTAGSSSFKTLPKESARLWRKGRMSALCFDIAGSPVEMLNYALIGSAVDYGDKGPIRADLEYNAAIVRPYHQCSAKFIETVGELREKLQLRATENSAMVKDAACWLLKAVSTRDQKPIVAKWIEHESTHAKPAALAALEKAKQKKKRKQARSKKH